MKTVDVFPAVVRVAHPEALSSLTDLSVTGPVPNGVRRLDRCRVAVVRDTVVIAVDSQSGPDLVFREEVVATASKNGATYLQTASGKVLAVTKDSDCGCGTRLKSWNPWKALV